MADADSFLALREAHRVLDELFLSHQEAIVGLDLEEAASCLLAYQAALLPHLRAEDELLVPLYAARVPRVRGAPPELFTGEHERMMEALARFHSRIAELRQGPFTRRRALALIDEEHTFKHLAEHHHLREEQYLYPKLDEATSVDERKALLASEALWARASPAPQR